MTFKLVRAAGLLGLLVASAPFAPAANQKEIDQALKNGTASLKARYGGATPGVGGGNVDHGIGPTALTGLALLEAGVPVTDAALKAITAQVRDASYEQYKTYQISLCLMYLDRYGDPGDVPLIQMLAVRLLVGQKDGGWGYDCCPAPSPADVDRLKGIVKDGQLVAGKPPAGGGKEPKLHPDLDKYGQALANAKAAVPPAAGLGADNSNTQFGLLAVWMSRKHGVPVENALDAIEKRFMATQDARTGNWRYQDPLPGAAQPLVMPSTPSMYCAGLLGMATAVARREERRLKTEAPGAKTDAPPKPDAKPNDPFFNPPAGGAAPPKPGAARPADARDLVVQRAFAGMGLTLADQIRGGRAGVVTDGTHGSVGDMYFLWSMERVGVIFGVDKIGGIDWYDYGSTALVRAQNQDGSWGAGTGYGNEVNTAFAVLFLCKSNLARDLSSKVQKDPTSTEMRAGTGPSATDVLPNRPTAPVAGGNTSTPAPVSLPNPTNDVSITLAADLLKATGADWAKLLGEARDGKGPNFTRALAVTAAHADGDRKKEARDALAERLCRMTPATLRAMLKDKEVELRRAAALACAMKDDKEHVPDLIDALSDADDAVARAAKAALKSLTGKDFGPAPGATVAQKAAAIAAWKDWYAKEKK